LTLFERYDPRRLTLGDLEVLRLVLRGDSVVDWRRLHFVNRDEVDRFLRLNLYDPDNPVDEARLRAILRQAVEYLRGTFRYKVAAPVAEPREIHDLFLLASGQLEPRRLRRIACVVLKVMHTVHHVEARELLFRARVSEVELAQMVDSRVREVVGELRDREGIPVVAFEGSAKTRASIITKLLAKKDNLAATVYDKHRYRIVVAREEALAQTVLALSDRLFPFSYVVPGQTQNSLLSIGQVVRLAPAELTPVAEQLQHGHEDAHLVDRNEFSGRTYRILNFIVDLPLRIDATVLATRRDSDGDLGRIVFAPVELQVVDQATHAANDAGENSHTRYKKRQIRRVLGRLSRGLVVPRGSRGGRVPRADV
jgi:uncharacterized protein (TIGR04552 family)